MPIQLPIRTAEKSAFDECVLLIKHNIPNAKVRRFPVAIVAVIGTNMRIPGFLSKAADALYKEQINVLALVQSSRQVNMQFILERDDFEKAQKALHRVFVENA